MTTSLWDWYLQLAKWPLNLKFFLFIETVIAKKRQIALNRRSKRNMSQDSAEELRLSIQNARDVLLSDMLPGEFCLLATSR